ncbi:hypothetical protein ACJRO7_030659 [Eucalyptus globulus]|uniref:Uncharacterized protein n=1 Tax=Eucalyptus globulus TaxID=34317 RepID=A0ABD3JEE5_EUCGL
MMLRDSNSSAVPAKGLHMYAWGLTEDKSRHASSGITYSSSDLGVQEETANFTGSFKTLTSPSLVTPHKFVAYEVCYKESISRVLELKRFWRITSTNCLGSCNKRSLWKVKP